MKVAIAGGTGLVGQKLCHLLKARGDEVIVLTRGESKFEEDIHYVNWLGEEKPDQALEGTDAFVNLAGVSLNDGRWTEERKREIYNSRMTTTDEILRIIESLQTSRKYSLMQALSVFIQLQPPLFIQSSRTNTQQTFLEKL